MTKQHIHIQNFSLLSASGEQHLRVLPDLSANNYSSFSKTCIYPIRDPNQGCPSVGDSYALLELNCSASTEAMLGAGWWVQSVHRVASISLEAHLCSGLGKRWKSWLHSQSLYSWVFLSWRSTPALQGLAEYPDLLTQIFSFSLPPHLPPSFPLPPSAPLHSFLSFLLVSLKERAVLNFGHCAQYWEYHNEQDTLSAPMEHSIYPLGKRRERSNCNISLW